VKHYLEKLHNHISEGYPRLKFVIGIFLVLLGVLALVTPLTPGSWLALVGLELVGIRVLTGGWLGKIRKGKEGKAQDKIGED
jgi:hypothetical protein